MWEKKAFYGLVAQACGMVPGFEKGYRKFERHVVLKGLNEGLLTGYGRNAAQLSLHSGRCPEPVPVEEINCYPYHRAADGQVCGSYIRHTVSGLRMRLRMAEKDGEAIKIPLMKKTYHLSEVLSRRECGELFRAPKPFKHRFLPAFAYSTGLRLNELRFVRISDTDMDRMQVRVHQGKGSKDRYTVLSGYIKTKLPLYLSTCKPERYLFEGNTPGQEMCGRSIQNIMQEAIRKTDIRKKVSLHTLRHSFATHLPEDGVDIYTIQHLLGHNQIRTTITYLHIAQVLPEPAKSPLDTLYNFHPS